MEKIKNEKKKVDTKMAILPIGAISAALNVHQRTLRIYDNEGILSPKRSEKNRRNYSLDDLEKARLVLFLTRNLALNLSGVKIILTMLEEKNITPEHYMEYIEKIATKAGINIKAQNDNIIKASKKGRKPKNI